MVAEAGLEPARLLQQRILSPACLPFHHTAILERTIIGAPYTTI